MKNVQAKAKLMRELIEIENVEILNEQDINEIVENIRKALEQ